MKKHILASLLLSTAAVSASAETMGDTLVIENVSKVRIETRDTVQRIVINGAKDDPYFHYTQRVAIPDTTAVRRNIKSVKDFNKVPLLKKKGDKGSVNMAVHMLLGLNTMVGAEDGWGFNMKFPIEWNIVIQADWHPYGEKNIWSLGFGLDKRRYSLSNSCDYMADYDGHTMSLHEFSLQIPLIYTHYFTDRHGWGFSLGAIANFNTGAYLHDEHSVDNRDYTVNTRHIGHRKFTVDGLFILRNPVLDLYCKYSPTTFFRNGEGAKMHQLSFGIYL